MEKHYNFHVVFVQKYLFQTFKINLMEILP
jgi:hypothetical protein